MSSWTPARRAAASRIRRGKRAPHTQPIPKIRGRDSRAQAQLRELDALAASSPQGRLAWFLDRGATEARAEWLTDLPETWTRLEVIGQRTIRRVWTREPGRAVYQEQTPTVYRA